MQKVEHLKVSKSLKFQKRKPLFLIREGEFFYILYFLMSLIIVENFSVNFWKIFDARGRNFPHSSSFKILIFNSISWVIYGHLLKDKVLMSVNIVAVLGAILTLGAILWVT